jgi:hypothetical protein
MASADLGWSKNIVIDEHMLQNELKRIDQEIIDFGEKGSSIEPLNL